MQNIEFLTQFTMWFYENGILWAHTISINIHTQKYKGNTLEIYICMLHRRLPYIHEIHGLFLSTRGIHFEIFHFFLHNNGNNSNNK